MISTVAPLAIRRSIFAAWGASDKVDSFERYLPPAAATALSIAGSSHVPNRSVLTDQETPTTQPARFASGPGDARTAAGDGGVEAALPPHAARTIAVAETRAMSLPTTIMSPSSRG